jgi:hypothetical protein
LGAVARGLQPLPIAGASPSRAITERARWGQLIKDIGLKLE